MHISPPRVFIIKVPYLDGQILQGKIENNTNTRILYDTLYQVFVGLTETVGQRDTVGDNVLETVGDLL
jgi:hypothetical protein